MPGSTFVGFGFGPIQSGLFLLEAHASGNFGRLVVAEVLPDLVDAVRDSGGSYHVNVADTDGIRNEIVTGVEIFNPREPGDREALVEAVGEASEISTALPSVAFYGTGEPGDLLDVLGNGLRRKRERDAPPAIVYAGENNNHAAEILEGALAKVVQPGRHQCLNTVIGKMSGVVADEGRIAEEQLATVTETIPKAFLVEAFNRILVSRIRLDTFQRGITVFEEKDDLLPFEEAKLYGHNAVHALLGYLLREKGHTFMAAARGDAPLMALARDAFLSESGTPLCRKYADVDPLFTEAGYTAYADDLLERMLNPFLRDAVARVTRDPRRKLGWNDRLIGTMRLALSQDVEPNIFARGAAAALRALQEEDERPGGELLEDAWADAGAPPEEQSAVRDRVLRNMEVRLDGD